MHDTEPLAWRHQAYKAANASWRRKTAASRSRCRTALRRTGDRDPAQTVDPRARHPPRPPPRPVRSQRSSCQGRAHAGHGEQARHEGAVVALVEEPAGLLALERIDQERQHRSPRSSSAASSAPLTTSTSTGRPSSSRAGLSLRRTIDSRRQQLVERAAAAASSSAAMPALFSWQHQDVARSDRRPAPAGHRPRHGPAGSRDGRTAVRAAASARQPALEEGRIDGRVGVAGEQTRRDQGMRVELGERQAAAVGRVQADRRARRQGLGGRVHARARWNRPRDGRRAAAGPGRAEVAPWGKASTIRGSRGSRSS